jgi:hypothetical protein
MIAALLLCLLQEPQPPESTETPPAEDGAPDEPGRKRVNRLVLIVNDECLTDADVLREIWQRRELIEPEEQERAINEIIGGQVNGLLKSQGGRDLGFDPAFVQRYVREDLERQEERAGSAGLLGDQLSRWGLDSGEFHESREAGIHAHLWEGSVTGRLPGPGGRQHVDRYVRPGRLHFEHARNQDLGLPVTVVLQELVVDAQRVGDLRDAERQAVDLRERILLGEDFGEVAVEAEAAPEDTRGMLPPLPQERLLSVEGVAPFLESAAPGDLSEVMPVRDPQSGVLRGYRLLKLISRDRPEPPSFLDGDFQRHLTERIQEERDLAREDEALAKLRDAAYVWPPEAFGRGRPAEGPEDAAAP